MRKEYLGIAAACASSCLGGASVVATRAVVPLTDPATLAVMRYGVGAICLALLVRAMRRPWPDRADLLPVALLGVLFFALFPFLFNLSLSYTTAARGSLALSTLPFMTLIVAALLRGEAVTRSKLAGVVLATIGVAVALGDGIAGDATLRAGDILMVATALCGAFYNVLSRPYLARVPALVYTTIGMIAGTAASLTWALAWGEPLRVLDMPAWAGAAIAFLGIGGAALTFYLWSYGLEHTTPTCVATTVTLNPIVAMALGTLLLGEPAPGRLALGLAAVALGIVLVSGSAPLHAWIRMSKWQKRRRTERILDRLTDRQLDDVGLLDARAERRRRRSPPFWWLPYD